MAFLSVLRLLPGCSATTGTILRLPLAGMTLLYGKHEHGRLLNRPLPLIRVYRLAGVVGQQTNVFDLIEAAPQFQRYPPRLDQVQAECGNQTSMGLDTALGDLGYEVAKRGLCSIKHRMLGTITGTIGITVLQQQSSGRQGPRP